MGICTVSGEPPGLRFCSPWASNLAPVGAARRLPRHMQQIVPNFPLVKPREIHWRDLLVSQRASRAGASVFAVIKHALAVDDHVHDAFAVLKWLFVRGVINDLALIEHDHVREVAGAQK